MASTALSLSAVERGNPPPRRKSCAACIKAKRRCDLRQPACLRCSQRKIDCSYPTKVDKVGKRQSNTASFQSASSQNEELIQDIGFDLDSSPWETSLDFNLDMTPSYNPSCFSYSPISFDGPNFQGLEFLEEVMATDKTLSSIPPTPGPSVELEDPMPMIMRPPKPVMPCLSRMQVLSLVSELVELRLGYTIDAFKRAPESMVLEGGTPWSHPAIYRDSMPSSLEDALGAYALYRAKNKANTVMIQRVIEKRYQKLLDSPIPTSSASELMAQTHALLIYQIMLYFDDSWAARTLASETISALSNSTTALMEFVCHLSEDEHDDSKPNPSRDIPLYPPTTARALYQDWTFQESMRRTTLVAFLLIQLQSILRADFSNTNCDFSPSQCPSSMSNMESCSAIAWGKRAMQQQGCRDRENFNPQLASCRSITLSAHLWHARDPLDFAVAWREKKHLIAQLWNVWDKMDAAEPDDIDQLGRMLMSAGLGIETTKAWFISKGGTL